MSEKFADWEKLFIFYLKRDWKKILLWIIFLGLFAGGFVPAVEATAEDQGLIAMYKILRNPSMTAIVGAPPVETAAHYTLGALYSHNMLLFSSLFFSIISILHVISHTKKEEDQGLTEYISSFKVGRQANSFSVLIETIFINTLLIPVIGGVMLNFISDSITVEGIFLYASSLAMAGIMGAALALVMAQIFPSSAGATGASLSILGIVYVIRGITDITNTDLSMLNPMGWIYLTRPFTENNWLYLSFGIIFFLIVSVIAFALESRRDINTGYLPENQGKTKASRSLLSVLGLFFRLNRGIIISWFLVFIFLGVAYGSIYGDLQVFVESNEFIAEIFSFEESSIEDHYTKTIIMVLVSLVSILPIIIINRLFTEERQLRLNQLFSTKVTRARFYWTNIILGIFTGFIGVGLVSGFLGVTGLTVMKGGGNSSITFSDFLATGYNQLTTLLFIAGLTAILLGWLPKLSVLPYIYLGYSTIINFGNLVTFPKWMENVAIQTWIPDMPTEDFNGTIFIIIIGISLVMIVIGYIGYNRRNLIEEY
ncbi:ABC transporter permease [Tetragenococcus halophilus subsp. flandriensis]|uniref:ABC transporter permease n=1 Tax=Tetragenococcus halophilus TaxID=51669 RepID=UPI0023E9F32C|nr:tetronasin resistance protein [Tetragenococcus halophilus]GMA08336.1 ABC transporter permease [Tetragenococcus halophilus subsp. flandriensis]